MVEYIHLFLMLFPLYLSIKPSNLIEKYHVLAWVL